MKLKPRKQERASRLVVVLAFAYLILLALVLFKYPGINEIMRRSSEFVR